MAARHAIRSLSRPNAALLVPRSVSHVFRRSLNNSRDDSAYREYKESVLYRPTLFSLTTPYPKQLTKDEFFRSLQLAATDVPQPHRSVEEDRTIVILTTPSFATWIEDVDFLGKVVNTLSKGCDSLDHLETTAAVVDGLRPAREAADHGAASQSAEGFSFMITSGKSNAQPHHLEILRGLAAKPDPFSGLRFNFLGPSFTDKHALLQCTVPLANTLFSNGRTSTLLIGKWVKDLPNNFVSHSLEYKEAYTVCTEDFRFSQSSTQIPLEGLTKPRRIVAGMGNIVRQLEGDNGKPLPASTELEESVVTYLNQRNLPQQQVSVWALVIPEWVLRRGRVESIDPSTLWPLRYILRKKASLHRVLSGGGGWGIKAGLLSLDPETAPPGSEGRHDFDPFQERFAGLDEQKQALGDIAKIGSYVWFLVAHKGLVDEKGNLATVTDDQSSSVLVEGQHLGLPNPYMRRKYGDWGGKILNDPIPEGEDACQKILLGCVRSTIDDVPTTDPGAHLESKDSGLHMQMSAEFSALTERGIFVRVRSMAVQKLQHGELPRWVDETASKIDVPGALFYAFHHLFSGMAPGSKHRVEDPKASVDRYHATITTSRYLENKGMSNKDKAPGLQKQKKLGVVSESCNQSSS